MQLDLERPRDLGALLGDTFRLYGRHFLLFAGLALLVVLPLDVLAQGVWGAQLWSYDDSPSPGVAVSAGLITQFVGVPLVTAMHVNAVMEVGRGNRPSAAAAVRCALAVFTPLMLTLALMWVGLVVGFLLLVIPGIYLWIRWYLVPQAVVVDGLRFSDAFDRSSDLVEGSWWRVFGIVIVMTLVLAAIAAVVGVPLAVAAGAVESGPLLLASSILSDTVTISFTALTSTLIYFDLRARDPVEQRRRAPDPPPHSARPEYPA